MTRFTLKQQLASRSRPHIPVQPTAPEAILTYSSEFGGFWGYTSSMGFIRPHWHTRDTFVTLKTQTQVTEVLPFTLLNSRYNDV